MRTKGRVCILTVVAMVLALGVGYGVSVAQGALTTGGGASNFGTHRLNGGFMPDPYSVNIVSGGSLDASSMGLGGGCRGYVTRQPDVILHYSNPASMLRFFVQAGGDTTLVINDAAGRWYCNDDAVGTNPMVTINNPPQGQYDVWIGSYTAGQQLSGQLRVTELSSQQPHP